MENASLFSNMTGGPGIITVGLLAKAVNEKLANLDNVKERLCLRVAQILASQTEVSRGHSLCKICYCRRSPWNYISWNAGSKQMSLDKLPRVGENLML